MTQEELDALMNGDDDLSGLEDSGLDGESAILDEADKEDDPSGDVNEKDYKLSATKTWPPPPPTEDHKVVNQLDDVTRDSEVKATQIFDKLESLSNEMNSVESDANGIKKVLASQKEMLEKLTAKFPNIETFKTALENIKDADEKADNIVNSALTAGDEVMMAMDIMQYQDIHRQKIERVINVMRALSIYMNSLFEGKIDDSKRVSSATHIEGDKTTANVVDEDDIEALIASFGGKK